MKLWGKHGTCTNGLFDNEGLRSWSATMWGWIGLAVRFLEVGDATALVEKVRSERWYPKESGFQFSPTRRELLRTAQMLQTSLDVEVSAQPPNCVATLLTWQTALQMLCYLPEDAREAWSNGFPNLLIGMSWLTTKGAEFEMLGRVIPFNHIALETDSPHLCLVARRDNIPQLIHHQAQVLATLRNLPLAVIFSGTLRNVKRLFRL